MKSAIIPVAICSFFLAAQIDSSASATQINIAEFVNPLAIDLYKKLGAEIDGNFLLSPYGISSALAMAYGGAHGETAEQMKTTLHFGGQNATHLTFSSFREKLIAIEEKGCVELCIANSLWPQASYEIRPDYLSLIRKFYDSEVGSVDYKTDAKGARQTINGWANNKTKNRIKDLIPEDMLSSGTRLVLANAIYFKGDWQAQFQHENTEKAPFNVNKNTTTEVSMMHQTKIPFGLAHTNDFRALELPYKGLDISMLILLPNEIDGLHLLEKTLTTKMISSLEFSKQTVLVDLPKFKFESSFNLGNTLAALGMPLPFSNQADFSGMNQSRKLWLNTAMHKTFVEVNERGTEACGTLLFTMITGRGNKPPAQFTADHPFLFLIRENTTDTILFIGRVADPSK